MVQTLKRSKHTLTQTQDMTRFLPSLTQVDATITLVTAIDFVFISTEKQSKRRTLTDSKK